MPKKRIDRFSIRYSTLKAYVWVAHRIFYRRYQSKFWNKIPKDRPVLLAPNHQNALMDAMAPLMTSRRDPIFLARADVFSNRFLAGILRLFKILPVYRIRDGVGELGKNEAIFNEAMEVLQRKRCPVTIMPEGNHGDKRKLRPLVKGIFRVAFKAQEAYGENPGVLIQPVGIDYRNYPAFRSHLFIQYGEPIEVSDYWAEYLEQPARAQNNIRKRLAAEMHKYIIDIQSEDHYEAYMALRQIYNPNMREHMGFRKKDLYHELMADQEMIRILSAQEDRDPEAVSAFAERIGRYMEGVKSKGMRDWIFRKTRYKLVLLLLAGTGMLATFPLFIYGALSNLFPYWLTGRMGSKPKDVQFHSTFKFVMGLVLFPLYYLILFIPVWILASPGWIKWVFLASLPLTGLFAHSYMIRFRKLLSMWKYQFQTMSGNEKLKSLKQLRITIISEMDSIYTQSELSS